MNNSEIKVFQLNEFDWWAGENLESVKADYVSENGLGDDESDRPFVDPHELSDADMDRLHFVDGDEPINEDGTRGGKKTFREELALMVMRGDSFPCFFASTEY